MAEGRHSQSILGNTQDDAISDSPAVRQHRWPCHCLVPVETVSASRIRWLGCCTGDNLVADPRIAGGCADPLPEIGRVSRGVGGI